MTSAFRMTALLLSVAACAQEPAPARPQWVVSIGTDASVPQFGDRLLVEVYDGAEVYIERQFGLGEATQWPISFGLTPLADDREPVVRARIYRSIDTDVAGRPRSGLLIDAAGLLAPASTVERVNLPLWMECFGVAGDVNVTCDPSSGELVATPTLGGKPLPELGSWPPGKAVTCAEDVPAEMRCIDGGAFLLGFPDALAIEPRADPVPERLVQLSPFALDENEVTVGTVRGLIESGALADSPVLFDPNPDAVNFMCAYLGPSNPSNDALSVNCVGPALAEEVCSLLGKELPTEAQWEYAAGNLATETPYPWGLDDDVCDFAHVAWGRGTVADDWQENQSCRGGNAGPVAGGHEADITTAGVRNLGGNLGEWVADHFDVYTADCWQPDSQLLIDPVCNIPGGARASRGGSYAATPLVARIYYRHPRSGSAPTPRPATGFRCAKSELP